ncbi:MAG: hypothetical protein QM756_14230 [Polyangiaceae bacterium]
MIPTLFGALVVLGGLLTRGGAALSLGLLLCLFGAAAAVSLPALGGATLTPAVVFLPFLLWRALSERAERGPLRRANPASFWLVLLAAWGALSATLLPRLLAGRMQILTVDRSGGATAASLLPLTPVSGNITQTGYALGGALTFVAARRLLQRDGRLLQFRDAALWLCALNCAAAVWSLLEFHLGLPSLLSWVRTANYAIFDSYEEAGLMRIQGTFSESSAFAAFTLPLFAFSLRLWLGRVGSRLSGTLALCSLLLLLLSTSTTAYAALGLYLAGWAAALLGRFYLSGGVPRAGDLLGWSLGIATALGVSSLLWPQLFGRVAEFAQMTVLSKMQSSSGVERNAWNQQAWSNFVDTFGLGVGLGSARASGFALVLLSNVGVVGTLLFLGFWRSVWRSAEPGAWREGSPEGCICLAARQATLAALTAALVSAAVFDLGIAFYVFAAAASVGAPTWALRSASESSLSAARWQRAAASHP